MKSYSMCPFVPSVFHFTKGKVQYIALFYDWACSIIWIYHNLSTHFLVDGHLCFFHFLSIINNAAWTFCKFLSKYIFSILSVVHLKIEFLGCLIQFCKLYTAQHRDTICTVDANCITYNTALFDVNHAEKEIDLFFLFQKLRVAVTGLNGFWWQFFLNELNIS